MIEILKHLHHYVPTVTGENSQLLQVGFAGDQLTTARAQQAIDCRVNSKDKSEALRGVVPFACDWHAKANFMSVRFIHIQYTVTANVFLCIIDHLATAL